MKMRLLSCAIKNKLCKESIAVFWLRPRIHPRQYNLGRSINFDWDKGSSTPHKVELSHYQRMFTELRKLGEGAHAQVFLCRHNIDGCLYAVKQVQVSISLHFSAVMELEMLPTVTHPNIVRYYHCWFEQQILYFQMEYCQRSLVGFLSKERVISIDFADHIFMQLLDVHIHLSSKKIIHRDIRPANVLLDDDLNGKLTDFGLAEYLEECGTVLQWECTDCRTYRAPEVKMGRFVSSKVDIYSIGLVYFRLLLHTLEWSSIYKNFDDMVHKFRRSRKLSLRLCAPSLVNRITIIKLMTARRPHERPSGFEN